MLFFFGFGFGGFGSRLLGLFLGGSAFGGGFLSGFRLLGRGFTWLDTGTMESLAEATEFVRVIQNRQGIAISVLEEIAFRNGWISREDLLKAARKYGKSPYGNHLRRVAEGKIRG